MNALVSPQLWAAAALAVACAAAALLAGTPGNARRSAAAALAISTAIVLAAAGGLSLVKNPGGAVMARLAVLAAAGAMLLLPFAARRLGGSGWAGIAGTGAVAALSVMLLVSGARWAPRGFAGGGGAAAGKSATGEGGGAAGAGSCVSIQRGMTAATVRAVLGKPDEVVSAEAVRGPGAERWSYARSHCLVHMADGVVEAVE